MRLRPDVKKVPDNSPAFAEELPGRSSPPACRGERALRDAEPLSPVHRPHGVRTDFSSTTETLHMQLDSTAVSIDGADMALNGA
jgi:hypothetical protein